MEFREFKKMWHKAYWQFAIKYSLIGIALYALFYGGFLGYNKYLEYKKKVEEKEDQD